MADVSVLGLHVQLICELALAHNLAADIRVKRRTRGEGLSNPNRHVSARC